MGRRKIEIGLAGLGNVGMGVYANVLKNSELLSRRANAHLNIRKIAVRDLKKARDHEPPIPSDRFTNRWEDLIEDDEVDVIVELIGGIDQAKELVISALRKKKVVVTGNKALLAEHGQVRDHADRRDVAGDHAEPFHPYGGL